MGVTATAALTVVMVTGTVVVMATVAAAVAEEDVATERSPGMVDHDMDIKRGTRYLYIYICIYLFCVSNEFQDPISTVPFLFQRGNPVCLCVCVYEVHSFSSRSCTRTLQRTYIQIHNS